MPSVFSLAEKSVDKTFFFFSIVFPDCSIIIQRE